MVFYVCSHEKVASRAGLSGRSKLHWVEPRSSLRAKRCSVGFSLVVRHREEPQGVDRRPSFDGLWRRGDPGVAGRALRSPGLLRHSPSGRTGVSGRPMARNDDRGSNQLQFARVFFLSPTGSREGFVTARNSQPPRPEAPRSGLEGRLKRRQRGNELDHPSRREAWLRSLRHEAVGFGVVQSSILGVTAARESAAKVLK